MVKRPQHKLKCNHQLSNRQIKPSGSLVLETRFLYMILCIRSLVFAIQAIAINAKLVGILGDLGGNKSGRKKRCDECLNTL